MPQVTFEKFFDDNTTSREARNGRIYEGVVGWKYQAYLDGKMPDDIDAGRFERLKDLKRRYPNATRKAAD